MNDSINGALLALGRMDVWLTLAAVIAVVLIFGYDLVVKLLAAIAGYVTPPAPALDDAARFAASDPVPEPGSMPVQPVLTPNDAGSPEPAFPDSFTILAALVEAEVITATRAYDLLGVRRGGGAAYKDAQQRLAAARLKVSGQAQYRELDAEGKPTGRTVSRPRRGA